MQCGETTGLEQRPCMRQGRSKWACKLTFREKA